MNLITSKTYLWSPADESQKEVEYLHDAPPKKFFNGQNPNHTEIPPESYAEVAPTVSTMVCPMCWIKVIRTGALREVPVDELSELSD